MAVLGCNGAGDVTITAVMCSDREVFASPVLLLGADGMSLTVESSMYKIILYILFYFNSIWYI